MKLLILRIESLGTLRDCRKNEEPGKVKKREELVRRKAKTTAS